jgi:hypothetical protein
MAACLLEAANGSSRRIDAVRNICCRKEKIRGKEKICKKDLRKNIHIGLQS